MPSPRRSAVESLLSSRDVFPEADELQRLVLSEAVARVLGGPPAVKGGALRLVLRGRIVELEERRRIVESCAPTLLTRTGDDVYQPTVFGVMNSRDGGAAREQFDAIIDFLREKCLHDPREENFSLGELRRRNGLSHLTHGHILALLRVGA